MSSQCPPSPLNQRTKRVTSDRRTDVERRVVEGAVDRRTNDEDVAEREAVLAALLAFVAFVGLPLPLRGEVSAVSLPLPLPLLLEGRPMVAEGEARKRKKGREDWSPVEESPLVAS